MNIENEIIYLGIPYSFNPEQSFHVANKVAAELMKQGNVVFSPVTHSHPIADYMKPELRCSHEFWMGKDLPILRLCSKIIFIVIGDDGLSLIDDSKGCQDEKAEALKCNIPIEFLKYKY
jgi:hypothetical protein